MENAVTVHSVPSNTLRDAQNLCYSHKFARHVSGFLLPGIRKKLPVAGSVGDLRSQKTPRGILPVNSNQKLNLQGLSEYVRMISLNKALKDFQK